MSEVLKISSYAEVLSPLSNKRLPLKIDFTLKSARVEVLEMSETFSVYLVKDSYKQRADDDKYCSFATTTVFTGTNAALGYLSSSSKIM
jgi:hypothetical protein